MPQRILVPALITLGITILRLVGELQGWSPALFNKSAGGGAALIGIAWLPIIFGPWFAWQLVREGSGPASSGRALLVHVGALLVFIAAAIAFGRVFSGNGMLQLVAMTLAAYVALFIASKAWPSLFKTLLSYAFAARIPVVIVMLLAILGSWGTHYDALPPGPDGAPFAAMSPIVRWFWIGLLPQFGGWIAYTVIVGGIFGSLTAMFARRPTEVRV